MKTFNLFILAMTFFGMTTLANAQEQKACDKKECKKECKKEMPACDKKQGEKKTCDKSCDKKHQADKKKCNKDCANCTNKCQKGPRGQKVMPAQKGRMSHMQGTTLRGGAPRYGLNRPMAPRGRMVAAQPRRMSSKELKVIELTDEMKAHMTKKEIKEYEKAVKNAKKEFEKAQKEMAEARKEMEKAKKDMKDARKEMQKIRRKVMSAHNIAINLHHAKRYTQKANRIAIQQHLELMHTSPVA